jgi:transcription antitermination factor NusA-like protein
MAIIDIRMMRYINLLDKVSRVKTRRCFDYNNTINFAVPAKFISQAIGNNASNVKFMQEKLGRRIKIVKEAEGLLDLERFLKEIIAPVNFKSLEIQDNCVIITAGSSNKAALIGRNKRRLEELALIVKDVFGKDLKIV